MEYQTALAESSRQTREVWRWPPALSMSDWADEHFRLSPESSSTPGRWRTRPYQREPMDLIADPTVRRISVMKSSRTGFTKTCIDIPIGYYMHLDPRSILVVQPTETDAEEFSKEEIGPMLRDVGVLQGLVADGRAKGGNNTLLLKAFPGGQLHIGGANSARVFRRITVRLALMDEVDAMPASAGGEGDPVTLADRRMADAWDRKLVEGSSPKLLGTSRIAASFAASDQRRWWVPCPLCDAGQILKWGGKDCDYGIKWERGEPESAYYLCEHCLQRIAHHQKPRMVDVGEWIPGNPEGAWPGFAIWAGYSYLPGAAWPVLVNEWIEVKGDHERLQVFVNTVLGEPFEALGESPPEDELAGRVEAYPQRIARIVDGEPVTEYIAPNGVVVLTAGVDVQGDRLEVQVIGWGLGEESWALEYHVLEGDPTAQVVWQELDALLKRPRYMERGGVDYIRSVGVDSNYATTEVCLYLLSTGQKWKTPDGRLAYAWGVRGRYGPGAFWPREPGKAKNVKCNLWTLKVDSAKEALYSRASAGPEAELARMHWHDGDDFAGTYFKQFTSEQAHTVRNRRGYPERIWSMKPGRLRNEALDTYVYAYGALWALYMKGVSLEREANRLAVFYPPDEPAARPDAETAAALHNQSLRVSRSSYLSKRRK